METYVKALAVAAERGDAAVAVALLAAGTPCDQPDSRGYCPLYLAASNGHAQAVQSLLSAKASPHTREPDDGVSPLHRAAAGGHAATVRPLVKGGAEVDAKDDYGCTPLHTALESAPDGPPTTETTQALLEAGAGVYERTHNNWTPLHLAALHCTCTQAMEALLDAGAEVNSRGEDDKTPLMNAAHGCNEAAVNLLLERGARAKLADCYGHTALLWTLKSGTGFHPSVEDHRVAKALIKAGAPVNTTGPASQEISALYTAASNSDVAACRIMVEAGADVNWRMSETSETYVTERGFTPLHAAVHNWGHAEHGWKHAEDLVMMLTAAGADLTQQDAQGRTPAQHCSAHDEETAAQLRSMENVPAIRIAVMDGQPVRFIRRLLRNGQIDPDDCIKSKTVKATLASAARCGKEHEKLVKLAFGFSPVVPMGDPRRRYSGWRPSNHWLHHGGVRSAVMATLTAARRLTQSHPELPALPQDLWLHILTRLSRRDFVIL